ncbi:MAG: hypothetical protein HQL32_17075 [Planctomycetes bacterium]|nr:hypothetical protein [Planctomycetota bacterium]
MRSSPAGQEAPLQLYDCTLTSNKIGKSTRFECDKINTQLSGLSLILEGNIFIKSKSYEVTPHKLSYDADMDEVHIEGLTFPRWFPDSELDLTLNPNFNSISLTPLEAYFDIPLDFKKLAGHIHTEKVAGPYNILSLPNLISARKKREEEKKLAARRAEERKSFRERHKKQHNNTGKPAEASLLHSSTDKPTLASLPHLSTGEPAKAPQLHLSADKVNIYQSVYFLRLSFVNATLKGKTWSVQAPMVRLKMKPNRLNFYQGTYIVNKRKIPFQTASLNLENGQFIRDNKFQRNLSP